MMEPAEIGEILRFACEIAVEFWFSHRRNRYLRLTDPFPDEFIRLASIPLRPLNLLGLVPPVYPSSTELPRGAGLVGLRDIPGSDHATKQAINGEIGNLLFHRTESGRRRRAGALASVRRSNCTYGFPVCSFHEDT